MIILRSCVIDNKVLDTSQTNRKDKMTKGQRAGDGPIAIEVEKDKSYYWCACGQSKKQPFCDGSHKGTEFNPIAYKDEETKKMFFCACKQTNNQPFCDGSHNK
jgi:CDGSH iron-sulfur domain-containing protein 3